MGEVKVTVRLVDLAHIQLETIHSKLFGSDASDIEDTKMEEEDDFFSADEEDNVAATVEKGMEDEEQNKETNEEEGNEESEDSWDDWNWDTTKAKTIKTPQRIGVTTTAYQTDSPNSTTKTISTQGFQSKKKSKTLGSTTFAHTENNWLRQCLFAISR